MNSGIQAKSRAKLIRRRRFWIALGFSVLLGLLYPVSILVHLGAKHSGDAHRLIIHDPGFVVNMCLLTPLAIAVFVGCVDFSFIKGLPRRWKIGTVSLWLMLTVMAALTVLFDLGRGGGESQKEASTMAESPARFEHFEEALEAEKKLREKFSDSSQSKSRSFKAEIESYRTTYKSLSSSKDVWRGEGSIVAKVALILNAYAAVFVSSFFWYLTILILRRKYRNEGENPFSWLWVIVFFMSLWFPLRAYSEWYREFGDFSLEDYPALILLLVVLFAASLMGVFVWAKGVVPRIIVTVAGAASSIGAALAAINPSFVGKAHPIIEGIRPPVLVYFIIIILAVPFVVMAYSVVQDLIDGDP